MSLSGARPDRTTSEAKIEHELDTLRKILEYLPDRVGDYESCREAEKLLACIWSARESLSRIEALIQDTHLTCCLIPAIRGPSDLALALSRLRDRRLGATIVCEHQQDLGELAAGGVPIGVSVSVDALESIFDRRSRLREGAVIVRGDGLVAAGVPLPLGAEKDDKGVVLTDRQRAAVAFSRITDALVLVVDEGTGDLSVALDGHLMGSGPR